MFDLREPLSRSAQLPTASLGTHLGFDVVERWGADDREANEENVGLGIRQRSEAVVIFLSCGIPQAQANGPAIHHHTGCVIVKTGAGQQVFGGRCGAWGTNTVGIYSPGNAFVV